MIQMNFAPLCLSSQHLEAQPIIVPSYKKISGFPLQCRIHIHLAIRVAPNILMVLYAKFAFYFLM